MYKESKKRAVVKTIVWKVIATTITWGVFFVYTGNFLESVEVTIIAAAIGMIAYYIHERAWNKVTWGKIEE